MAKKKRRLNSRAKGCRAEREAVNLLRKVFKDDAFRRRGCGFEDFDIIVPDWFPFVVEVKDRKDMTFKRLLTCMQPIGSFMDQAESQAVAVGRKPNEALVLFKVEGRWWAAARADSAMGTDPVVESMVYFGAGTWVAFPAESMIYAKEKV
jgi:hypothetical protein